MPDFSTYVGVDVSKSWLDVHLLPCGVAFRVTNDKSGWKDLLARLRRLPCPLKNIAIGAEASGGYEKPLLNHLAQTFGLTVFCLDPAGVRAYAKAMGRRAKTDPIDAAVIAGLLSARAASLQPYAVRPDLDRLTQLIAFREQLVAERTRLTGHSERLEEPMVRRLIRTRLAGLALTILQLDKAIAEQIASSPNLADLAQRLGQVPGVGKTLIATLLAHLPELGQINPKALAALVGVAPIDRQSGKLIRKAHCYGGRAQIRRVLYMATLAAVRCKNPPLKAFYERLRTAGKSFKQAIVATMRKFLTILNAISRNQSVWRYA